MTRAELRLKLRTRLEKERDDALAEIERLREIKVALMKDVKVQAERAEAAEARTAKLVEALEAIDWIAGSNDAAVLPFIKQRAVEALAAAKASEQKPNPLGPDPDPNRSA